jgi:hypothetical protein
MQNLGKHPQVAPELRDISDLRRKERRPVIAAGTAQVAMFDKIVFRGLQDDFEIR